MQQSERAQDLLSQHWMLQQQMPLRCSSAAWWLQKARVASNQVTEGLVPRTMCAAAAAAAAAAHAM
jgi:hypothetical protein